MPDPVYQIEEIEFASAGVFAKAALDALPANGYLALRNCEPRQEGALSSRLGRVLLSHDGLNSANMPAEVNTLARLKGLDGAAYRYAGITTGKIYRGSGTSNGSYSNISGSFTLSGERFSSAVYRPDRSAVPYIFFADEDVMVKDNGTLSPVQRWGVLPPAIPPSNTVDAAPFTSINLFDTDSGFSYYLMAGHSAESQVNTTLSAAISSTGYQEATVASGTNILAGSLLLIGGTETVLVVSASGNTFTANFTSTHSSGAAVTDSAIAMTTLQHNSAIVRSGVSLDLSTPGGTGVADNDVFSLLVNLSDTSAEVGVKQVWLLFYTGSFWASCFVSVSDVTAGTWTRITALRSAFSVTTGFDWTNVDKFYVGFLLNDASATVDAKVNSYSLTPAGSDLSSETPYDYRITYYNEDTGAESNPSITWVTESRVTPAGQRVVLSWTASSDSQVTHVRVYRRGGSQASADAWYRIGQVAVGTTTFTDNVSDGFAITQAQLEIDNDPPVTSALREESIATTSEAITGGATQAVTVDTISGFYANQYALVDIGDSQEEIYIQSASGTEITAYFQRAHDSGIVIRASTRPARPMKLCAQAFERMWVAGDPDNPNILYYSKVQRPESFPPQNTVEVGTPDDPIMAVVATKGQLFVFTLSTVYSIQGHAGSIPRPVPTGAKHGLVSNFGWYADEGVIYYQALDGPRVFTGGESQYIGWGMEWVWAGHSIPSNSWTQLASQSQSDMDDTLYAFHRNELYISFVRASGNRYRYIYDTIAKRWREDDLAFTAMLYEKDLEYLLVADSSGGVFRDRVPGQTSDLVGLNLGVQNVNPIAPVVMTGFRNQGISRNEKNYLELWLDLDTNDEDVTVTLYYNNGASNLSLGTVSANGRSRIPIKINAGLGLTAFNYGLQLSWSSLVSVTLYHASMRYTVLPERRRSWDTHQMDFGDPSWKFVRSAWFMYEAFHEDGISVDVYVDGESSARHSFTLPQSTTRAVLPVGFPVLKGKTFRFVANSDDDFRLYGDSYFEWKPINMSSGYAKAKIQEMP